MGDPRQGEPGSARHELWWAIWDNYTGNTKTALIDNLITEHSAAVRDQDPVTCPCCGREAHYCG